MIDDNVLKAPNLRTAANSPGAIAPSFAAKYIDESGIHLNFRYFRLQASVWHA